MTGEQKKQLNGFFVNTFNEILAWEDQSLRKIGRTDLSVREMHIIEAVSMLEAYGKNTMANIARVLVVSPGSLTTAVNVLVRKGYLKRQRAEYDRRVVLVTLTQDGAAINEKHKQFHEEMMDFIGEALSEEQIEVVIKSLGRLVKYFGEKANVKR